MSDNPSSQLLGSTDRPRSNHSHHSDESHEDTPLLSRSDDTPRYDGVMMNTRQGYHRQQRHHCDRYKMARLNEVHQRRATVANCVAVGVLGLVVLGIIAGAFFAPAVVEEYAKEALVIEPTNLSIDSFTTTGVRARVQALFRMDASRVKNKHVRNIGRFGTWIAREVESQESKVEVYLPEYGNILVGTAAVPRVVVDIQNGHTTAIDFLHRSGTWRHGGYSTSC
jgi:hypothetical protein